MADWSGFLPPAERRRAVRRRSLHRLWTAVKRPRSLLLILLVADLALALALGLWARSLTLAVLALLPLLLAPPLGYLAYWLLWHDFHR